MPDLETIHNTFRSKAKVSEHYTWYMQAILNSMLPQFLSPFKTEFTAEDVSGEYLEAMRIVANKYASDLKEGEKVSLGYADVRRALGAKNDYWQTFEVDSIADTINYTLGKFDIARRDGKLVVDKDSYDFPPEFVNKFMAEQGRMPSSMDYIREAISLSQQEGMGTKEKIHRIAHLGGEFFMPEGDENNLVASIEIPEEPAVVASNFDDDYSDDKMGVFRGPMTSKRKDIFDSFIGLFVGEAQAEEPAIPVPAPRPSKEIQTSDAGNFFDNFFDTINAPVEYLEDKNLQRRGNTYTPIGDTNYRRDKKKKGSGGIGDRLETFAEQIGFG